MLTFELESYKDGWYTYIFYPEGDEKMPGIVAIHDSGKGKKVKDSDADVKGYYLMHALNGIEVGKDNGIVAWC